MPTDGLPADPVLRLCVVNTRLRDRYADLDALCDDLNAPRAALEAEMDAMGYVYSAQANQFIRK